MTQTMLTVADELYQLLEVIPGKRRNYRSHNMNHRYSNDMLNFMFDIIYHVHMPYDDAYMTRLQNSVFGNKSFKKAPI